MFIYFHRARVAEIFENSLAPHLPNLYDGLHGDASITHIILISLRQMGEGSGTNMKFTYRFV
jgi:hypothetical protein